MCNMVIKNRDQVVGSYLWRAAGGFHELQPTTAGPHLGCSLLCSWPVVGVFLQPQKNEMIAPPTHFRESRMMFKGDVTL